MRIDKIKYSNTNVCKIYITSVCQYPSSFLFTHIFAVPLVQHFCSGTPLNRAKVRIPETNLKRTDQEGFLKST